MSRLDTLARWICLVAATTATFGAWRASARRARPTPSLAAALASASVPRTPHGSGAYLVARAADCAGNFDFLDLFDRPPIRDRVTLLGALALDGPDDATTLRRTLALHGHPLDVWTAPPSLRRSLASLGLRSTPYLIVLDAAGALHFATGAPESIPDYLALGNTLPLLGGPPMPHVPR